MESYKKIKKINPLFFIHIDIPLGFELPWEQTEVTEMKEQCDEDKGQQRGISNVKEETNVKVEEVGDV